MIEQYSIEPIPEHERKGRGSSLFTIWFAIQVGPVVLVTGALGPLLFGQSFLWTLVAALIGNLVGAILVALHAAQGPWLGVPQMIQSRGQFGAGGSVLLILIVILIYFGFFASTLVTGGQAVHQVVTGVPTEVWIVVGGVLAALVAMVGYDLIHRVGRLLTIVAGLIYVVLVVVLLASGDTSVLWHAGPFQRGGFLAMLSTSAVWQISLAPYVSDYSRYMPRTSGGQRSTFWWTYAGLGGGAVVPMAIGAAVAAITGDDVLATLDKVVPAGLAGTVLVVFGVLTLHINSMNLYGSVLTGSTLVQTFKHDWLPSRTVRVAIIVGAAIIGVAVSILWADSFLASYSQFLVLLGYLLVPWSVINLLDYYVVRHGDYDVSSFFAPAGGIYGWFSWPAIIAYVVGVAVEIPFLTTSWYTGPLYDRLGFDASWVVSAVVTIPLYLFLARGQRTAPAALRSDAVSTGNGL